MRAASHSPVPILALCRPPPIPVGQPVVDAPSTNAEKVVAALTAAARPMGDTELARITGITPRSQVNGICNRLVQSGVITRERCKSGEITNALAADSQDFAPNRGHRPSKGAPPVTLLSSGLPKP